MTKKIDTLEEISAENVPAKPYTLRSLNDEDFYPMLDIVANAMPESLSGIFVELVTGMKSVEEIGGVVVYKIVLAVLRSLSTMPDKIYPLLSDLSGIPADEIRKMPFGTTPSMIWDIVNDVKNADFFAGFSKSS